MAFAFGQKTNLVQSGRSGINPIKWGFVGDLPSNVNGEGIDAVEFASKWTPALMNIPNTNVCGTIPTCIGDFGAKGDPGVTSGNNINLDYEIFSKEEWRNIGIPPNASGITFYIQTRPGTPGDVIIGNRYADCKGTCYQGTNTQCCDDPDSKDLGCLNCREAKYCCPADAVQGGEAGNYVVHIDLTNVTQQYLYLYTSWFNGTMEPVGLPCIQPGSDEQRCTDNMRFVLFPSDGTESDPSQWPHSDMNTALASITAYKGGHFIEATDSQSGGQVVCGIQGQACTGDTDSENCTSCDYQNCLPCTALGGTIGSDSTCIVNITPAGIAAGLTATDPTSHGTADFWGPLGTGRNSEGQIEGFWGEVFNWTTSSEGDWFEPNVGGDGGSACIITCASQGSPSGFNSGANFSSSTDGDPLDPVNIGCTCSSIGNTGGQAVGFHVG